MHVDVEEPEQYLDEELRKSSEISFVREMMAAICSHTVEDFAEVALAAVMDTVADYVDAEHVAAAWNVAVQKQCDPDKALLSVSTESEDTLRQELEATKQTLAEAQRDVVALRKALHLLRHACKESKAVGIRQTLDLISKVN